MPQKTKGRAGATARALEADHVSERLISSKLMVPRAPAQAQLPFAIVAGARNSDLAQLFTMSLQASSRPCQGGDA
jgi:hypothetical protein